MMYWLFLLSINCIYGMSIPHARTNQRVDAILDIVNKKLNCVLEINEQELLKPVQYADVHAEKLLHALYYMQAINNQVHNNTVTSEQLISDILFQTICYLDNTSTIIDVRDLLLQNRIVAFAILLEGLVFDMQCNAKFIVTKVNIIIRLLKSYDNTLHHEEIAAFMIYYIEKKQIQHITLYEYCYRKKEYQQRKKNALEQKEFQNKIETLFSNIIVFYREYLKVTNHVLIDAILKSENIEGAEPLNYLLSILYCIDSHDVNISSINNLVNKLVVAYKRDEHVVNRCAMLWVLLRLMSYGCGDQEVLMSVFITLCNTYTINQLTSEDACIEVAFIELLLGASACSLGDKIKNFIETQRNNGLHTICYLSEKKINAIEQLLAVSAQDVDAFLYKQLSAEKKDQSCMQNAIALFEQASVNKCPNSFALLEYVIVDDFEYSVQSSTGVYLNYLDQQLKKHASWIALSREALLITKNSLESILAICCNDSNKMLNGHIDTIVALLRSKKV